MATRNEVVREQLEELKQDLHDLWTAIVVDPKKQARKERVWRIVAGVAGGVSTVFARKIATKVWAVLTGEEPPTAQQQQKTARQTVR